MKQKIVIKLQMDCERCRNKALKTAAEVQGVTSVSLEGDAKDSIAVIGDDVDTVCLANQLKKKFRTVTIVSVEKVKSAKEKEEEEQKKKEKEKKEKEEQLKKCRELLCQRSSCHGKCTCGPTCTNCESNMCDGHCVTICFKCQNAKCHGQCKPCSKCQGSKCSGDCPCPNCHSNKCHGCNPKPPSCPPWCTCPKCYVPYPCPVYRPYPPNCTVVYDHPDTCSIQ